MTKIEIGQWAGAFVLTLSLIEPASAAQPQSWGSISGGRGQTTRLVGLWATRMRSMQGGEPRIMAIQFSPDGMCRLAMLSEDGEILDQKAGRFNYNGGLLNLSPQGRQMRLRLRWKDASHFVIQGEQNVWERISLDGDNDDGGNAPECPSIEWGRSQV